MNTLQIQVACGGIEPQFLKQELCPLQHKLLAKNKYPKPPQHLKSKSPRKYQKFDATCSTTYVLLMRCEVHKQKSLATSQQLKSIAMM
jgi:hypothetical protein